MLVKSVLVFGAITLLVTTAFAHLPPSYDASLRRQGRIYSNAFAGMQANSERQARSTYSFKGNWSASQTYSGDHTQGVGDTVVHGNWNGRKLVWWAKFGASGEDEPGKIKEAGTSAWVLINSLSAAEHPQGRPNYQWRGWNGDLANHNASAPWAVVPTWRNGAEGAYSFTHDDIGAMPFDKAVLPGWRVAQDFPDIKQGWGVFVGNMSENDWVQARQMVMEGHEMFNHSYDHTSAANRWFIFNPGDVISPGDPDIPADLRGLTVLGAWTISAHFARAVPGGAAQGWAPAFDPSTFSPTAGMQLADVNGDWASGLMPPAVPEPGMYVDTIRFSNALVDIFAVPYWEGWSPSDKGGPNNDGIFRIVPKQGTTEVIIEDTGQRMFVNRALGRISVNAVGWFETTDLIGPNARYPFWNNTARLASNHAKCPNQTITECDRGRPGMVLKMNTANGWNDAQLRRNVNDANQRINDKIYSWIKRTPYFVEDKVSEYFGYPFDVYSEATHAYLEGAGFVGARGGAKSGKPMAGDFFHPYRIDFDAFFIERKDWTPNSKGAGFVFPDNAHVLLGLNEMVDKIIESKGYMIREFHSVADIKEGGAWYNSSNNPDSWPVNDPSAGVGGWWGGIAEFQLRQHYEYLQQRIDADKIVVYTPSEAVKYRMVANAVTGVNISVAGNNYTMTVTATNIDAKYHDEISVIIGINPTNDLAIRYGNGSSPYRRPKKMNNDGSRWSVNVNPFRGPVTITPGEAWNGPTQSEGQEGVSVSPQARASTQRTTAASFAGIRNGQVNLNISQPGNYTVQMFNVQGRMIGTTNINAVAGINATNLRTDQLARGLVIIQVRNDRGASVLQHRFMLR